LKFYLVFFNYVEHFMEYGTSVQNDKIKK